MASASPSSSSRVQRCGACKGCKAKECFKCRYCLDTSGHMKKCCVRRQCVTVVERRLQRESRDKRRVKKGCNQCEGCNKEACGECLPCLDRKMFNGEYLYGSLCAKKVCRKPVFSFPVEPSRDDDVQDVTPKSSQATETLKSSIFKKEKNPVLALFEEAFVYPPPKPSLKELLIRQQTSSDNDKKQNASEFAQNVPAKRKHVKSPDATNAVVKKVTEKCQFCDVYSKSANSLYRHLYVKHFNLHFKCTLCGKTYPRAKECRNHVRKTHRYLNKILNNCVDGYVVMKSRLPSAPDGDQWEECVLPSKIPTEDKKNFIAYALKHIGSLKVPWAAETCPSCEYVCHDLNGFKLHLSMSKDCLHFFHVLSMAERKQRKDEEHNSGEKSANSKTVRLIFKSASKKTKCRDFVLPIGASSNGDDESRVEEALSDITADQRNGDNDKCDLYDLPTSSSTAVKDCEELIREKIKSKICSDHEYDDNGGWKRDLEVIRQKIKSKICPGHEYDDIDGSSDDSRESTDDFTKPPTTVRCVIDASSQRNFVENPSATAFVSGVKPLSFF